MRIIIVLILSLIVTLSAQVNKHRTCGVSAHQNFLSKSHPNLFNSIDQSLDTIKRQQQIRSRMVLRQSTRTISVVVHIVHNTSRENISDAQIASQIRILNEDFRRKENTNGHNTHNDGADTNMEFRLATLDPNGNPTNGITRTRTSVTSFSTNDDMKFNSRGGKDAWDTTRYLNMWVCNMSGGILGYAQFPGGPSATDGVVVLFSACGDIGTASAPFDLGRTATHEVGHWLGLRHIWGDGGCMVDDGISDTPRSDQPNFGKPQHPLIHCGSDDMFENYMDYSDDGAMSIFTKKQSELMNSTLDVIRSGVIRN